MRGFGDLESRKTRVYVAYSDTVVQYCSSMHKGAEPRITPAWIRPMTLKQNEIVRCLGATLPFRHFKAAISTRPLANATVKFIASFNKQVFITIQVHLITNFILRIDTCGFKYLLLRNSTLFRPLSSCRPSAEVCELFSVVRLVSNDETMMMHFLMFLPCIRRLESSRIKEIERPDPKGNSFISHVLDMY